MKYLLNLRETNMGDDVITSLIFLKDSLASFIYLNSTPFFNSRVTGQIMSAKLCINLITKFTFSRKDWTNFLLEGNIRDCITLTHSG